MKPKDPVNIQEISDEDDDGDQDMEKEEDNNLNMINSRSLGSSDKDDADTTGGEANKAHGRSRKSTTTNLLSWFRFQQKVLFVRILSCERNVLKLLVIQKCIFMIPLTLALS